MKINWFPGHMNKALRMMCDEIKNIDVILYVLDARAPFSCLNPKFSEIVSNKPIVFILNKIDLADDEKTKNFVSLLKSEATRVICLDSRQSGSGKTIEKCIRELANEKI